MNQTTRNIDEKLRRWEAAMISGNAGQAQRLADEIYKLVFLRETQNENWDELILRRLGRVLASSPPDESIYGKQVRALLAQRDRVILINNLLHGVLNGGDIEEVLEAVRELDPVSASRETQLHAIDLGQVHRERESRTSAKLAKAVELIARNYGGEEPGWITEAESCANALRDREVVGCVNVLLVHQAKSEGLVSPINAAVQHGTGISRTPMLASPAFASAIERARLALVSQGFLAPSVDSLVAVDLSDASYSGGSVALGAAVAIYSFQNQLCVDPFAAFTGDIKPEEGEWKVSGVDGVSVKLQAAVEAGIRTVFLPAENMADVSKELSDQLRLIPVLTLTELIMRLHFPAISARAETLQLRKVRALEAVCAGLGWQLTGPVAIQDGSQFTISPPASPELKLAIYSSGSHSPKRNNRAEFAPLLDRLNEFDSPAIPLRPINEVLNIKDERLRERVAAELRRLRASEEKAEQHCDYSLVFDRPPEKVAVKQYSSGKLTIQGRGGDLYQKILEAVVPLYNVHYPNAKLDVGTFLKSPHKKSESTIKVPPSSQELPLPYIGTDESGKGDYFGPLVVAAVWVGEGDTERLELLGVRDSKLLTDDKCRAFARAIRDEFRDNYQEVEIPPDRYNTLYDAFKKEKKTLNHLLAWGHARALETVLERRACEHAVADQFGDESFIRSKLMERGKSVNLLQTPKAERFMAVAAASVLARDRFLSRLEQASREAGINLPKGASQAVVDAARSIVARLGAEGLRRFAKLHFKTTDRVLDY